MIHISDLTIVTPTYNSSSTIEATLSSIQPLIALGAHHIIVDSGSSDSTLDIAARYNSTILFCPPGNMYEALNLGFKHSSSNWLTYINSDDILYSDYVISLFSRNLHDVSIIYGNIDYIDASGRFLFSRRSPVPFLLRFLMPFYNPFPQQGTIFSRQVFDSLNCFNTQFKYASDYDFFVRSCLSNFRFFKFNDFSVAAFRLSPTQLSQASKDSMAPEGIFIRRKLQSSSSLLFYLLGGLFAKTYRRLTNIDGIILRKLRGRRLDSGWR